MLKIVPDELYIFVFIVFILLLHEMNTNKYAHQGEQFACFNASFPGQFMTPIVIQFVRLVAALTRVGLSTSTLYITHECQTKRSQIQEY